MRTFVHAMILAAGLSLVAPTPTFAASPEAKEQKGKVKDSKGDLKELDKVIKKYGKAVDKGKETGELDETVMTIVKRELKELRQMGIKTNAEEPEPTTDGIHTLAPEPSEHPWLEKFRDQLVAVRDAKNPKPRLKQLNELRGFFATRLERQEKKLDKM